jgi:hypothetical protein
VKGKRKIVQAVKYHSPFELKKRSHFGIGHRRTSPQKTLRIRRLAAQPETGS